MENKTIIYILLIVGMVAIVAIVSMLVRPSSQIETENSNAITANVVSDEITPVSIDTIGRFIVGISLIGAFVYMYTKWE
ncbi:MAG: hypothetical protein ACP5N1_02015 [Candidatus Woesearchaeota archaeon]